MSTSTTRRVATDAGTTAINAGACEERPLVPAQAGSQLALSFLRLAAGGSLTIGRPEDDVLVFASEGSGTLALAGAEHELATGAAALVLAGEEATVTAGAGGLALLHASVGPDVDRHAPIGSREVVARLETTEAGSATGKRSFQVLFGAHNGSLRGTLFMGYIPPGRAPWHYHLYDEIVWVWHGPGRLHLAAGEEELPGGAAFRLTPRELHIVENAGSAAMAVLGLFTPGGSPSAAYLPVGSDAAYAIGPAT